MPTLIEKFGCSLRSDGFVRTAVRALGHLVYLHNRWIDGGFDRRFGTDTCGIIAPSALALQGEHAHAANRYEPVQIPVFRRIMRDLPVRHEDHAFVDFGSGKGRALLMASQYPFRRVIGVELSSMLHAAAVRNAAVFERRHPGAARIELVCGDALRYPLPEGHVVCFLYNPFGRPLVQRLIENLDLARLGRSRHIFVVYRNPVCADLFDQAGFLHAVAATRKYRIYRTH
jgi:SAM-dependent methyltransferase